VLLRDIEPGQTVAASFQTPVLFQIAQDLAQMQIDLSVDEADVGQIREGLPVSFTVDAYPDRQFSGEVRQVRLAATATSNVITYPVVVQVQNADLSLLPGMTASAEIVVDGREGVLKVPNAALRYTPPDAPPARAGGEGRTRGAPGAAPGASGRPGAGRGGARRTVWVLEGKAPTAVSVEVGVSDGTMTEVTGVQEGQQVVIGQERPTE
jgi:HlyD family secretion protein